jgi:hypothetical protein
VSGSAIRLETGQPGRFAQVGDFVSYCPCVKAERTSNGKKKGVGNTKNGNQYLAWAFIEAANFAIRHYDLARRYYQRKTSKTRGGGRGGLRTHCCATLRCAREVRADSAFRVESNGNPKKRPCQPPNDFEPTRWQPTTCNKVETWSSKCSILLQLFSGCHRFRQQFHNSVPLGSDLTRSPS